MKAKLELTAALLFVSVLECVGQTALPHRFNGITTLPHRTVSLTLTGRVASTFRPYFDIYPIEVSSDLVTWKLLTTLVRTNASTNALVYLDTQTAEFSTRFYRTFTNQLVTPFTRPSGQETVGRTSRLFTDLSRTNRYGLRTNSSFVVSFWYPAQPQAGILPAPFDAPQLLSQWDDYAGQAGFGEKVRSFVSHSYLDLPMAKSSDGFPVLIFSLGANSRANYHSDRFEDLASHGYIVAAIEHSAAGGVIFDGKAVFASSFNAGNATESALTLTDRVRDFRFVLDELPRLNDSDPTLAGRIALEWIGAFGFSFGAGVAAEFARVDPRCKAVAVLEGSFQGADQLRRLGVGKPVLSLYTPNGDKSLFTKAERDAVWLAIKNTEHADFSGLFLVTQPSVSRREPPLIQRTCLVSFFNKYLKELDDHFLDSAPTIFPRVTGFLRK